MSIGRAILVGASLAVLAIAVGVAVVLSGVLGPIRTANAPVDGPVLVALVLPSEAGVLEPRVIDLYTKTGAGWSARSVSPTLPAVVSGTSGSTLADAYTFGGGAALAKAYDSLGRGPATSWVVVDPAAWSRLAGSTGLPVDLPAHMEVFDGKQLVSFEAGASTVPAAQVALLLDGAAFLPAEQNAQVRAQVGDRLSGLLARAQSLAALGVSSDLGPERLAAWTRGLGSPTRAAGD